MKAVVDTNLLIRYQTKDDKEKADAVELLLDKAKEGKVELFLPGIVIAEYNYPLKLDRFSANI